MVVAFTEVNLSTLSFAQIMSWATGESRRLELHSGGRWRSLDDESWAQRLEGAQVQDGRLGEPEQRCRWRSSACVLLLGLTAAASFLVQARTPRFTELMLQPGENQVVNCVHYVQVSPASPHWPLLPLSAPSLPP